MCSSSSAMGKGIRHVHVLRRRCARSRATTPPISPPMNQFPRFRNPDGIEALGKPTCAPPCVSLRALRFTPPPPSPTHQPLPIIRDWTVSHSKSEVMLGCCYFQALESGNLSLKKPSSRIVLLLLLLCVYFV